MREQCEGNSTMVVLGLETSCDDTSVALVRANPLESKQVDILSNVVASQNDYHRVYGGVVPEVAARKHVEFILPTLKQAFEEAGVTWDQVDAITVTTHPGLVGSLFVGVGCAQTLAYLTKKPLVAVSHLKAHFFSVPLDTDITYPFVGLLVSGGHTLLARCDSPLEVEVLGTTLDDACGECFDKVAKYYGLGFPGGPALEKEARNGDENAYDFPQSNFRKNASGYAYNFSFSGLKTAVIHHREKYCKKEKPTVSDLAASLQRTVVETLWGKTLKAAQDLNIPRIGICGGVAANGYLRKMVSRHTDLQTFFPAMSLCTDNAAMIAGLGCHYFREGLIVEDIAGLKPSAQAFKKSRIV